MTTRTSAAEFDALRSDGRWRELVDGTVVLSERLPRQGIVSVRVATAVQDWINAAPRRGFALMRMELEIDEHNVFVCDLAWLERPAGWCVPGLCVEIRSPNRWRYDLGPKLNRYQAAGLRELWLVDTAAPPPRARPPRRRRLPRHPVAHLAATRGGYARPHEHGNGRAGDRRGGQAPAVHRR